MIIGFTGTQKGMSKYQMEEVRSKLEVLPVGIVHHGDCIGADEQFHAIASELGLTIIIHPPSNESKRAFCQSGYIRTPKDYIDRNHDIVNECDTLIATPFEMGEVLRSGTWATIRYAQKKHKTIWIIYRKDKL